MSVKMLLVINKLQVNVVHYVAKQQRNPGKHAYDSQQSFFTSYDVCIGQLFTNDYQVLLNALTVLIIELLYIYIVSLYTVHI